jgi:hypothetical protein
MFSNGNSFANGNSHNSAMGALAGEARNTEPAYVRMLAAIQPGAVS